MRKHQRSSTVLSSQRHPGTHSVHGKEVLGECKTLAEENKTPIPSNVDACFPLPGGDDDKNSIGIVSAYINSSSMNARVVQISRTYDVETRAHQQRMALLDELRICIVKKDLKKGRMMHQLVVQSNQLSNIFVATGLVNMYSKCGCLIGAFEVFDTIRHPDVVCWNALIFGHVENGDGKKAIELFAGMTCSPNALSYLGALKACRGLVGSPTDDKAAGRRYLAKPQGIHSQLMRAGYGEHVGVVTTLLDLYANCSSMPCASRVFEAMHSKDLVSWTALTWGYAENGEGQLAIFSFCCMQREGFAPDGRAFVAALKACTTLAMSEDGAEVGDKVVKSRSLVKGKGLHIQALQCGFLDTMVCNTLLDMYAKCGSMVDARKVFERMLTDQGRRLCCSVVSWNTLLFGYVENGEADVALEMFHRMVGSGQGCSPNARTLVAALKACASLVAVEPGWHIHSEFVRGGLENDVYVVAALVDFYAKCGCMTEAQNVFDLTASSKNLVSWNALLAGYARQGDPERALQVYQRMEAQGLQADPVTLLSLLNACCHAGLVHTGKKLFQAMLTAKEAKLDIEHYTCMADLFGRANDMEAAVRTLRTMPFKPDCIAWRMMLSVCQKWKNIVVGRLAFEFLTSLSSTDSSAVALMSNIYRSLGMSEEC